MFVMKFASPVPAPAVDVKGAVRLKERKSL